jgi:hypothetical protein
MLIDSIYNDNEPILSKLDFDAYSLMQRLQRCVNVCTEYHERVPTIAMEHMLTQRDP